MDIITGILLSIVCVLLSFGAIQIREKVENNTKKINQIIIEHKGETNE